MKKIILTLLLTLSTLINVNAVAAFSLDIDGNGTINASNDGLIIFKYLLNSNANNLHTTISSNAADDRKTTAQLKAYLDNSGDILDIDGNGTTNASNDGLIVFKYLLNSNANNLHTTIASNAVGSKTTTINLKAYLDQYISTDVSNMYSGDRPTELTAEQIADANGAADDSNAHLTVLRYANFGDYVVNILSDKIVIRDESDNYAIVYEITSSENNLAQLDDAEFQALYLEVIQAIWDLINPVTVESEVAKLYAAENAPTSLGDFIQTYFENEEVFGILADFQKLASENYEITGYGTTVVNINLSIGYITLSNGDEVPFPDKNFSSLNGSDLADWALAIVQAIWDLENPNAGPTYQDDLIAIFASDTTPTELTPLLTAEANRVANTATTVDNKELFTNLSGDGVTVAFGVDGNDEIFTVSSNIDGNSISNNVIANDIIVTAPSEADLRAAFFNVILEKWNQLHPSAALEDEITAIYEADLPPTELTDLIKDACESYGNWTNNTLPALNRFGVTFTSFDGSTIVYNGIDNTNNSAGSNTARRTATLEIMTKIWHVGHPNYVDPTTHAARSAVLTAYNSIDGISNITVKLANSNNLSTASVYLTWKLNEVAQDFWYFSATNPTSTTDGEVRGDLSYLSPEQFETYRERLYNKLTDHIQTPAKLRAARIVEIKVLDDASDNVIITNYIDPTDGDTFIIDVLGEPSLQSEYSTTTYESGVQGFGYLGTTQWDAMKKDISDKIDEIDIALTPTITDELAAFYSGEAPDTIATGGDAYGNQLPPAIHTAAVAAWNTNIHDTMLAFLRTLSQEATGNFGDSTDPVTTNGISYYGSTGFVVVRNLDRGQVSGTVAQGGDGGYGYHDIDLGSPTLYLNGWSNLNFTHLSETNFTTLAYHVMSNFYDLQQTVRQTRILDLLSIDSRLYVSRTDDGSADSVRRDSGSGYQNIGVNHYGSTQTGVTTFEGLSTAQYAHYRAYVVALQF